MGKILARLDEKVNLLEILRNFSKFSENFLKENCEKYIILAYFSEDLTNFAVIFRQFGRKCKLWEIFQKSFKHFQKIS